MLKKTITFKNPFTGEPKTEEWYFNINKAEATELAMSQGEGMEERIRAMMATSNGAEVLKHFKSIISLSVCKRDEDDNVLKSPEISQKFMASEAYSELFLEFVGDPKSANAFLEGMMPSQADLQEIVAKIEQATGKKIDEVDPEIRKEIANDDRPAWEREDREPTQAELTSMTKAQLVKVMQRRSAKSTN